MLWPVG